MFFRRFAAFLCLFAVSQIPLMLAAVLRRSDSIPFFRSGDIPVQTEPADVSAPAEPILPGAPSEPAE